MTENTIEKGLKWLSDWLSETAGTVIIYRSGTTVITVTAIFGRPEYEIVNELNISTGAFLYDFYIVPSELGLTPHAGDIITYNNTNYEVMRLGDSGVWSYSDPYKTRLVVHTKKI